MKNALSYGRKENCRWFWGVINLIDIFLKFLFIGAGVEIRNPKVHDRVVQKDPMRTLEYLSFESLLDKRIEEGKKQ